MKAAGWTDEEIRYVYSEERPKEDETKEDEPVTWADFMVANTN